jgi:predicted DNA-binding protein
MAKKMTAFKLNTEIIEKLEQLAKETGKTKTDIIEMAILCLYDKKDKDNKEVELYKKENEQLKMVLQVFKEREKTAEELKATYERFLQEKEERIKELKERIEELKTYRDHKKPFWKFWK